MKKFSVTEALSYGWQSFKIHYLLFITVLLIFVIVSVVMGTVVSTLGGLAGFLATLLTAALDIILGMGLIYITLKVHDNEPTSYKDLLTPIDRFLPFLGASILYGLIVFGGVLLLVVPGIIWAIKYHFFRYSIIDKDMDTFEALKESGRITQGSKMNLFWFMIVIVAINFIGALPFGLGLIITVPVTFMAFVYVYRKLLASAPANSIEQNSNTSLPQETSHKERPSEEEISDKRLAIVGQEV